jgi:hypothetical protein
MEVAPIGPEIAPVAAKILPIRGEILAVLLDVGLVGRHGA